MRTGPAGACAAFRHAARSAARVAASLSSSGVTTATCGFTLISAAAQRSATGIRAGRRPRLAGSMAKPGGLLRLARAAASVSASRASVSTSADACPPAVVARHSGGIAAASSRARCASAPDSTGRQRAA